MLYRLHGLTFRSEVALPHWPRGSGACDAKIYGGEVAADLPAARKVGTVFAGRPGVGLLTYSDLPPVLVNGGLEIVVGRGTAPSGTLRRLLSGTAVALLLHQRGRLCLHASSVVKDGRAHLIVGASGAGKSTTAAALVERGATLLADDITAIDFGSDGALLAFPGLQTLRLRRESMDALPRHAQQAGDLDAEEEKHLIASPGVAGESAYPVGSITFLRRGEIPAPAVTMITGTERVAAIEKNLFRPRMARIVGDPRKRFLACTQLAARVPLRELVRPQVGFHLDGLCAAILD